ncbi:MAG: hypothetical protein HKN23_17895, partial [Verrucomicrobiales bacterium]|nr:hypothetical protein [Verrucomicrobiales bacterium]
MSAPNSPELIDSWFQTLEKREGDFVSSFQKAVRAEAMGEKAEFAQVAEAGQSLYAALT